MPTFLTNVHISALEYSLKNKDKPTKQPLNSCAWVLTGTFRCNKTISIEGTRCLLLRKLVVIYSNTDLAQYLA